MRATSAIVAPRMARLAWRPGPSAGASALSPHRVRDEPRSRVSKVSCRARSASAIRESAVGFAASREGETTMR